MCKINQFSADFKRNVNQGNGAEKPDVVRPFNFPDKQENAVIEPRDIYRPQRKSVENVKHQAFQNRPIFAKESHRPTVRTQSSAHLHGQQRRFDLLGQEGKDKVVVFLLRDPLRLIHKSVRRPADLGSAEPIRLI
jgi:hypothetical protein